MNEPKYIDAEKIKQTFCAECNHTLKCEDCDIDYHLRHAPAADVAEVRHGRWERRGYHLHCSCCDWSADLATPHCPGCGAYLGGDV